MLRFLVLMLVLLMVWSLLVISVIMVVGLGT